MSNTDHVPGRVWAHADKEPDQPILAVARDDGSWQEFTWSELARQVRSVAAGLVSRGVAPGDRVAIMSPTRMEWTVADLAILSAGAVTVPIYDTSSPDQCRHILQDADAALTFAATAELADRVEEAGQKNVIVFDDGGLDELFEDGDGDAETEVDRRQSQISLDDVATIVYTSGTTGDPKGCVLTHRNLAWTIRQTRIHFDEVIGGGGNLLHFLPLAHIFARVIQFVCLDAGLRVGYPRSMDELREDLNSFQPTFLLGVPRVFEKFFETAKRQATGVRKPVFQFAVSAAHDWAEAENPGPWSRARRALADRLVYRQMRAALGGRADYCVSGGAPLSRDLGLFFLAAGVPVLEGYGLTETTAPAAVNTPSQLRIGTVGKPLPGVEIRIDDGEVLVKGGNVFAGYHNREDSDFDGEWYRTGDLGELDDDGYLTLKDRKKELIVTASGKNVVPTPLEEQVADHDLVAQAMLVGDQKKFVAALITLDDDGLREFAERHKLSGDIHELRHDDRVRDEVQRAIDEANRHVSRAESIRKFVIVDRQFSEDEGELTPTLKLRRRDIAEHFSDEIESIYA
ncbi:MAG TPA: long-chain fatty acid--CoA ligase [Jiangellaceae bacterium]|nr:long-chain fatty acid--CoA ligase [Jiangellaceae bacterium]